MRVALATSLILLATLSASLAAPYRVDPRHHQDGHPNAATVVPSGWRLEPLEGAWRGSRYVSPDGSSWFAAYALPVDAEPVAAHMDTIARQKGEAITYFRRERDWLAVSGVKGDRIFYRKAVIAYGGPFGITLHSSIQRLVSDKWTGLLSRRRRALIAQSMTAARSPVRPQIALLSSHQAGRTKTS